MGKHSPKIYLRLKQWKPFKFHRSSTKNSLNNLNIKIFDNVPYRGTVLPFNLYKTNIKLDTTSSN